MGAEGDGKAAVAVDMPQWRSARGSESRAGCLSSIFFSWAGGLLLDARRKRKKLNEMLAEDDLTEMPDGDTTHALSATFEHHASEYMKRHGATNVHELTEKQARGLLNHALWRLIRTRMLRATVLKLINCVCLVSYPYFINRILVVVEQVAAGDPSVQVWHGYVLVVAFGVTTFVNTLADLFFIWLIHRCMWQLRSVMTTSVYRKTLRVTSTARQTRTTGEIVNLMQIDAQGISYAPMSFHLLWSGILLIAGYSALLYVYIDWATFVGLATMIAAGPLIAIIFIGMMRIQKRFAEYTDQRVKLTNEVLQGMQGIKMSGWEIKFSERLQKMRNTEVHELFKTTLVLAFGFGLMVSLPTITGTVSLSVYALKDLGATDASTLFTALSAFALLLEPLMSFPAGMVQLAEAFIRRNRIASFLALDEISEKEDDATKEAQNELAVNISNGTFYWGNPHEKPDEAKDAKTLKDKNKTKKTAEHKAKKAKGQKGAGAGTALVAAAGPADDSEDSTSNDHAALEDINLSINRGSLVGIAGAVGSGKSSLVNAILGEMYTETGARQLNGSVALVAQTAWIYNGSVRDNILFGAPMDEARYNKVLRVCQLSHDLTVLQDGDQTMIGERGINLSGGQKQRISIARAAYSQREIVIFDDPLSALDPEVAGKVFNDCIVKFLRDRTRILVTNQLSLLPRCDRVLLLQRVEGHGGRIVEQGRYASLMRSGLNFAKLVGDLEHKDERHAESELEAEEDADQNALNDAEGDALLTTEERAKGAVAFKNYIAYGRAGGGLCLAALVLFSFVLNQSGMFINKAWAAFWSNDPLYEDHPDIFYIGGYGLTGAASVALTVISLLAMLLFGLRASRKLHGELMESVFQAPMSFFDTTPTGRIVSRFSKDLSLVDRQVPQILLNAMFISLSLIYGLGAICFATPFFTIGLPFLFALYLLILNYYRPGMRDVKRIESVSRTPIYNHFSETLNGLSTIRAYDCAPMFETDNTNKVDLNIRSWYSLKSLDLWLFMRLNIMGNAITIGAGCLAIFAATQGAISPGVAGLSLTYAINTTDMLGAMVRILAEVEANFNSVERILYYTEETPKEKPFRLGKKLDPRKSWPKKGAISIRDLRMRYRPDTPLVLKGVTVDIDAGMRVGVVGRTGGGKSSLFLSLLRLVEPEPLEDGSGPITIDGVDVSKIGLHALRSKMAIVPQNPVIFSGTVRSNIDPFDQYEDDAIWNALEQCTLRNKIEDVGGLTSEVAEFGENFSQGERQLLVLARALLSSTRILLLDEATSSVDVHTDLAIQAALRNSFSNCTVLTIAHRLNTIIDSDRILVMDNGTVREFDAPANLLRDRSSTFSGMVAELGPAAAAQLRRAARVSARLSTASSSRKSQSARASISSAASAKEVSPAGVVPEDDVTELDPDHSGEEVSDANSPAASVDDAQEVDEEDVEATDSEQAEDVGEDEVEQQEERRKSTRSSRASTRSSRASRASR